MNLSDRIQTLRKGLGISQEELADRIGVSRQAVSKWESEQSLPDLDKVIALSEYFQVTTDYLLKGIEPTASSTATARLGSRLLYIASVGFMFIGLFAGIGSWYYEQTLSCIFGAMIIQAVGVAAYFIGRTLSKEKPCLWVNLLILLSAAFMPASMLTGRVFGGIASAYPVDLRQGAAFFVLYLLITAGAYAVLQKRERS